MANPKCPKCKTEVMHKVDGKKLPSGVIGQKYWMCLPCSYIRAVKHRTKSR